MLKTLAAQIKQYKKSTILTPIFAALEVVMEVLIPMAMARLVKYGIEGGDTGAIYRYGFLMMAMAMLSLVFGSVCAHTASHASTGFAANLRDGMYRNIQRFSFANIDKYSTAGLVTRMTTDVTNVQNAFQMITRIAVRSPLTLIFSMIAAFVINPELAGVFLIPLVLLGMVFTWRPLIMVGIVLYALVALFQLLTLPVEFNASRRALQTIESNQFLTEQEYRGAKKVLTAAALTYVAALASALATLLRLLLLAGRSDDR